MSAHRWAGRPGQWRCKTCGREVADASAVAHWGPCGGVGSLHRWAGRPAQWRCLKCGRETTGATAENNRELCHGYAMLAPVGPVHARLDTGERVAGGPVGPAGGPLPERERVDKDPYGPGRL